MANGKMTKKDWYALLDEIVDDSTLEDKAGAHEFLKHEIDLINASLARNKERTAQKREKEDTLKVKVFDALTEDFRTIEDIYDELVLANDEHWEEEITMAKVTNRLSALVRQGLAEKSMIKEGSRKICGYKAVQVEDMGE